MLPHLRYLWYVLKHKAYVLWAGLVLGVPLWQLLIHDLSKFSRTEWSPYVNRFFGPNAYRPAAGSTGYRHKPGDDPAFDAAWEHHWRNNPHHWNYWNDAMWGDAAPLRMPERYAREMVSDWYGAGMAQGKPDIAAWYESSKAHIILHPYTRAQIEALLVEAVVRGLIPAEAA